MNNKDIIKHELCFNPDLLTEQVVITLPSESFEQIKDAVIPSFCYDNALNCGKYLDADSIVYGAVVTDLLGQPKAIEHAWLKMKDGTFTDPTYQLLNEINSTQRKCVYFGLIEFALNEYTDISSMLGNPAPKLIAFDFAYLRRNQHYKDLFTTVLAD
ncbi:hypothetical protein AB4254_08255 [Vibrio breoganii]